MTADTAHLLSNLPPQVVQSIRAFRVPDLQAAAQASGQHFLYANLAHIDTKAEALELIGQEFTCPPTLAKTSMPCTTA